MLDFNYYLPTRIFHGEQAVLRHANELGRLGSRALLVTGRTSARKSGALDDVLVAFQQLGIKYELFDRVENNPSLQNVADGAKTARSYNPDFIVGIGGGSPLDAAKAIAILAANDIPAEKLYEGGWNNSALPLVAIPTTAGTGSEVTWYSVLTIPEEETKRGFKSLDIFPRIAYLDYRYTTSLPDAITVDTAVDALSHLIEGYLSVRASDAGDLFAERGLALWGQCIPALKTRDFSPEIRDKLLIASTLGGMTISHTGTALPHALGYSLTYYHGIPHGQANGLVMGEYLRFTGDVAPDRVGRVLELLGMSEVNEFVELMHELFGRPLKLQGQEIERYAKKASLAHNARNTRGEVTEEAIREILTGSLGS